MLATPKKPVAFNVEFDATVSTPDRILKKLKEAKERREMRRRFVSLLLLLLLIPYYQ